MSTRRSRGLAIRVLLAFATTFGLANTRCGETRKVVILGIDGMDPGLLRRFAAEGVMPNLSRLMREGDFKPLQTSMPPLSPVAWSTFITGMDPGGHGIFDFLHREPGTMVPEFSMSRAVAPARKFEIGSWVLPLSSGRVEQLRRGRAFWQVLGDHGVSTTLFRMPVNFPPVPSDGRSLSGMGTPDILGTPGTFSYYTTSSAEPESVSGGRIHVVAVNDNHVRAALRGPSNQFRRVRREVEGRPSYSNPEMTIDFDVYLDPDNPAARIVVQGRDLVLKEGDWSDWVRLDFTAVPHLIHVSSIGRFYLQEVRPEFRLYVTPLQINPEDPAMPISTPAAWSRELFRKIGYFYTQELPEDTKAFSAGLFSPGEFWQQSQFVYEETRRALDALLDDFEHGVLFVYFSSLDQGSHMLWAFSDPEHPYYRAGNELSDGLRTLYRQIDEAVGAARSRIDDGTTFIVMSDHGFCPFYRSVNLNTWLQRQGYIRFKDPLGAAGATLFSNVDWDRTRVYALGLNGVYVNLRGREPAGCVSPGGEYERLVGQVERELLALRDPVTGEAVVTAVARPRRDFRGAHASAGPDLIVGFNRGYRNSWDSPIGSFSDEVFEYNVNPWSGDHGTDSRLVPGVLLTNRRISLAEPALYDLTVAVLDEFGVPKPPDMIGRDCLAPR